MLVEEEAAIRSEFSSLKYFIRIAASSS